MTPWQDENKKLIVHSNDLITARYNLDIDGFRALTLFLSKVNQRLENPGWISFSAHEFQVTFDINKKNIWRCMKKAVTSLSKSQITFHVINGKKESFTVLNWLSGYKYQKIEGKGTGLKLRLNPDLDPFLFNIKHNFSWCFLNAITSVKNVISFRIYMYLLSHKSHPRCKKNNFFEVDISLDDFHELFPDASSRFDNLKKRTIEPAIQDINEHTNISVHWEPIKHGRSVVGMRFGCVEEKSTAIQPKRPRLAKRPHVKSGSHDEGQWMKKNAEILYQYEKDLKKYDPTLRLTMPDLRRAVECSKYCKQHWHEEKKQELAMREGKNTKIAVAKSEQNKDITFSEKDLELIQNI
ncbi:MAG TPA: replication initiation protein [Arsenophonus apicola]|uniref:replication initiation protein n=1 Tax=Arsenophonus apicola TaxID=2879119 RepID=UPI001CDCA185|nr:replication initiation protein [Arsenophonus apicola]UBX30989.1 replication initiation protein [Arsenophonus apicola]